MSEAQSPKVDVRGKRVLVVGLARSGRAAAHALRCHGAVVTVTDSRSPSAFAAEIPELLSAKIGLELGLHRQETFLNQDLIVVSPGVPWDIPQLVAARQQGVHVVPEVEAAAWFLHGRLVGITGSNGKTTTTTLLGRMLDASGFKTVVGGNIGVPLISAVDQTSTHSISVAELSSFQLEASQGLRVNVAVLLNITPNHLDRHASFDAYLAAKARILRNQTTEDCAVLNADDPAVMSLAPAVAGQRVFFSLRQDIPDGLLVSRGRILYRVSNLERALIDVAEVKLRGAFNLENVLAATAAACVLGADFEVLPRAVREFRGVEHRLEWVRQVRGVEFYNDSKATSVDATLKALSAFEGGVHLILGGKDKGAPYAPLRPLLEDRARRVLLIGAAAQRLTEELSGAADMVHAGDLETAVREAFRAAVPGDTVLLAPACASFDQFQDFEHRGRVFKEVVERLAEEERRASRQLQGLRTGSDVREREVRAVVLDEATKPARRLPREDSGQEAIPSSVAEAPIGAEAVSLGSHALASPSATEPLELRANPEPEEQAATLGRPELVYVYEVAAEELAPMEFEPLATYLEEAYEEPDRAPSSPKAPESSEPFLYEVAVAAGPAEGDADVQAQTSTGSPGRHVKGSKAQRSERPHRGGVRRKPKELFESSNSEVPGEQGES